MTELPPGWTLTEEVRKAGALEAAESAFVDGRQLTVRDLDGEKPAQAEWPTTWRANAVRYAWAQYEHRAAVARGEAPHPHVEPSEWSENLLRYELGRTEPVAPDDWTGPLHERPGLFARKDEVEKQELVLPAPERLAAPTESLPRTGSGIVKALGPGWRHRVLAARGPVVRTRKVVGEDGKNRNVKVAEMADSTTLRLRHADGRAAVVVWIDGKFDSAYAWRVCTDPTCPRGTVDHPADMPTALGAREVKALVGT